MQDNVDRLKEMIANMVLLQESLTDSGEAVISLPEDCLRFYELFEEPEEILTKIVSDVLKAMSYRITDSKYSEFDGIICKAVSNANDSIWLRFEDENQD